MNPAAPKILAGAILAHAVFAYLAADWVDINILVTLAAICSWPFWWAAVGFSGLRTRAVWWCLAIGSVVYAPSVRVILMMVSPASGGRR